MKLRFATLLETLTSVAFVPPIPKPMQLSAGRFNLPVWNIAPFLSRLLSFRNRIAAPNWLTVVTAQDMLKTSARLFEFHRCTVYTVPPSCSPIGPYCSCFLFLLLHLLCGRLKWYQFLLIFCLLWPCWLPWCSPRFFSTYTQLLQIDIRSVQFSLCQLEPTVRKLQPTTKII